MDLTGKFLVSHGAASGTCTLVLSAPDGEWPRLCGHETVYVAQSPKNGGWSSVCTDHYANVISEHERLGWSPDIIRPYNVGDELERCRWELANIKGQTPKELNDAYVGDSFAPVRVEELHRGTKPT